MGVNARVIKTKIPTGEGKSKEMFISRVERYNTIFTDKIADGVAKETGAQKAMVKMIITSMTETIKDWVEEGHCVQIENFGTFMPSIKSDSNVDANKVGVQYARMTFMACRDISKQMKGVSCSLTNEFKTDPSEESTPAEPTTPGGGDENEGPDII